MGAVGSAQAEDGRASTSRRVHSCAKWACGTASAHRAVAAGQRPCSSQMSNSRSQQLQTHQVNSCWQQQDSWSTCDGTSKQAALADGRHAVSIPPGMDARPPTRTAPGIEVCGTSVGCCAPIVTNQGSGPTNSEMAQPAECMASLPDARKLLGRNHLKSLTRGGTCIL